MSKADTLQIEVTSEVGAKSQRGMVHIEFGTKYEARLSIPDATKVHRLLGQAIEAATSDEIFVKFAQEKLGFELVQAVLLLRELRLYRQGSYDPVPLGGH